MTHETHYNKGREGWQAKTTIDLGQQVLDSMGRPCARKLQISTGKGSRGGIGTIATCALRSPEGYMTFEIFGDFHSTVKREDVRCTEKSVRTQHAAILEALPEIEAEARTFYQLKDAKAKLHEEREAELAREDAKMVQAWPLPEREEMPAPQGVSDANFDQHYL